mmetsp:Transcript_9135/g.14464  ORF Transcript_9135/g.14464 Transcript_9135/m.14464 type:complete len:384 (-) Transcript_9135:217-1368(-)
MILDILFATSKHYLLFLNTVKQKLLLPIAHRPLVRLIEILRQHHIPILPHRLQPRLGANARHVRTTNLLAPIHVILQIQLVAQIHPARGRLKHHPLLPSIRVGEFDLPVQSSRSEQCRIQRVGAIGGHDHLDVGGLIESVHLIQQFQENTLHLAIGTGLGVESLGGDGVDLVDEYDAGGVFAREAEDVADHAGSFAEVLLDEFGSYHGDEGGGGCVGDCFCHHGFTCPRRTIQQDTPRRINPNLRIQMMLNQGQLNRLPNLLLLNIHPTNILISHIRLLAHELHGTIALGRQYVHHAMRMSMQCNTSVGFEAFPVQCAEYSHVIIGTGRGGYDTVIGIDHFVELSNDEGYRLDATDFFLGAEELALEVTHFVLEVFFLEFYEF